jgi:hypothetical protein
MKPDYASLIAWAHAPEGQSYLWAYLTREQRKAIGDALVALQSDLAITKRIARDRLRTLKAERKAAEEKLQAENETIRRLRAERDFFVLRKYQSK